MPGRQVRSRCGAHRTSDGRGERPTQQAGAADAPRYGSGFPDMAVEIRRWVLAAPAPSGPAPYTCSANLRARVKSSSTSDNAVVCPGAPEAAPGAPSASDGRGFAPGSPPARDLLTTWTLPAFGAFTDGLLGAVRVSSLT